MPNTTYPELCSLMTNMCKPPKNFEYPEIVQPFSFAWFEECPWVYYNRWEDKTYCLPCVLFGYKNGGTSSQRALSNMENSSKNIQKT